MDYPFKFTRRVQFADTDMAGIVHFATIFRYMEEAEHAFYRSLQIPIHPRGKEGSIGWPRVHAECDYKRPIRFEEMLDIYLTVAEIKEKAVCYEFTICKLKLPEVKEEVAVGKLVVVCSTYNENEKKLKSIPIPPSLRARLQTESKK